MTPLQLDGTSHVPYAPPQSQLHAEGSAVVEPTAVGLTGNPSTEEEQVPLVLQSNILPNCIQTDTNSSQSMPNYPRRSMVSRLSTILTSETGTWTLEIISLIISLFSMTAIVILLIRVDGSPLDEWQLVISPNTLISVLSTLVRVPLASAVGSCLGQAKWNWFKSRPDTLSAFEKFEEAGRGPQGSLKLLLWIRHG